MAARDLALAVGPDCKPVRLAAAIRRSFKDPKALNMVLLGPVVVEGKVRAAEFSVHRMEMN